MQKYRPKLAPKIIYCGIMEKNSGKGSPCRKGTVPWQQRRRWRRSEEAAAAQSGGGGRRRRRPRRVEVELGVATDEGAVVAGKAELGGGG
jgi:hypothetical protein